MRKMTYLAVFEPVGNGFRRIVQLRRSGVHSFKNNLEKCVISAYDYIMDERAKAIKEPEKAGSFLATWRQS